MREQADTTCCVVGDEHFATITRDWSNKKDVLQGTKACLVGVLPKTHTKQETRP